MRRRSTEAGRERGTLKRKRRSLDAKRRLTIGSRRGTEGNWQTYRRGTAHDAHGRQRLAGKLVGAGKSVGSATGYAQDGEASDSKVVHQDAHVGGPVDDAAVGLQGGEAEAGAVRGDDADAAAASDFVELPAVEARHGKAVEEEQRRPIGMPK